MLQANHQVSIVRDYVAAVNALRARRPDIIVAGLEHRDGDAILLLRHMKDNGVRVPLIVLAGRGMGLFQHVAMRLGAKAFLEYPVDEPRLTAAVTAALARPAVAEEGIPLITDEEAQANLSELEKRLNADMKCFAGRNLVYLQSYIGSGARPRICLKCPLRREFGLSVNVYYEFIRDVCCSDPKQCEAVQLFDARQNL